MNVDELVRDALRETAADAVSVPAGFTDRVLAVRRRRRTRRIVATAGITAAVVAVAVAVPLLGDGDEVRPASRMNSSAIIGHPDQSPPRDLIAAGDSVLAAFYVTETVKQDNGDTLRTPTYGLLNQKTGKYEKTKKWAFLDVAPGSRTAAVLEQELPAKRIGLLDLITGKVDRWIKVDHGVGGVAFSPDGKKLVATTYAKNPDRNYVDHPMKVNGKRQPGPFASRTGFSVVDVASGKSDWHEVSPPEDEFGFSSMKSRDDFEWSHDGSLLFAGLSSEPFRQYYDLNGDETGVPVGEKHVGYPEAGLSPNGKLVAGDFAGSGREIAVAVNDARTGKRVYKLPAQQLLAWADDKRLIAWGCDPEKCSGTGEFRNQLLLVTIGTNKAVPLSGFRKASADYPGRWNPIFSTR
ncbi:WD40 repeat domain-containing protein [Streptomyces sp. NPDC047070]|uniref:WD40 repeat domain-containing protein n=1 Tax=Streptomyces sp. NPDC047070 TaxID=3154923 RepID=UPI003451B5A9